MIKFKSPDSNVCSTVHLITKSTVRYVQSTQYTQVKMRLVCFVVVFWGIVCVGGFTHVTTATAGVTATLAMKPVVIIGKVS